MSATANKHQAFLEFVSEGMICSSRAEQFMQWVCRYVVRYMKCTHVSVALYDSVRDSYPVEVSTGKSRIPPRLVALNRGNSLVEWFQNEPPSTTFVRRSNRLMAKQDLKFDPREEAAHMLADMNRHGVDVCAKIQTHDRLAGYLLIGDQENGSPYSSEDLVFFQVLANNIAIEIEKESYHDLSLYDPLTGLLNRSSMNRRFEGMMQKVQDNGGEFAIALIDVDNFKLINDEFGHLAGDQVLKVIGEILGHDLRKCDLAFRYGGEEFLVLFSMNSRDPSRTIESHDFHIEIFHVLERLRMKIESRPLKCLTHSIPITVSIGLSFYDKEISKAQEELIQEADQALYTSKKNGKNVISVYPYL